MPIVKDFVDTPLNSLMNRREEGTWDDDGGQGPGFLKSLEALETFLTPAIMLGNLRPQLPAGFTEAARNDFAALLKKAEESGWLPDPYLTKAIAKIRARKSSLTDSDLQFVDSASFLITGICDAFEFGKSAQLDSQVIDSEAGIRVLDKCLGWLMHDAVISAIGTNDQCAWGWGHRLLSEPSIYFTYSALAALATVLESEQVKGQLSGHERRTNDMRKLIQRGYLWASSHVEASNGQVVYRVDDLAGTEVIPEGEEVVVAPFILEIFRMYDEIYNDVDVSKLVAIVDSMVQLIEAKQFEDVFLTGIKHTVKIRDELMEYDDRSLYYLTLINLSWASTRLKGSKEYPNEKLRSLSAAIREVFTKIREGQNVVTGLWPQGSKSFEIYRTQRAIEAISYALFYLKDETFLNVPASNLDRIKRAVNDVLSRDDTVDFLSRAIAKSYEGEN